MNKQIMIVVLALVAEVILVAVFPCGEKPNDHWRIRNQKVNEIIRNYADGKRVVWVDFGDRLLEPDGSISKEMMPDFLHPREQGYDIWLKAIEAHLE